MRAPAGYALRNDWLAAGGVVLAIATYAIVLAPITDVFTVPIHLNPLTAFGKALMARVGLLQAAAIALGIGLLMLGLVLPVRAASVSRAAGHVALSAATLILALECLMILSWIVTLWPLSNTTAINLGNETGSQTWPIDWHIQILFGFALLVAELTLATWALVTIMRPPLGEHAKHL